MILWEGAQRETDRQALRLLCECVMCTQVDEYITHARKCVTREGHCASFSIALYLTALRQGVSLNCKFTGVFLSLFSVCLLACLFLPGWPESSRNLPVSSLQFWGYRHAQPCSDFSMSPGNLNSGHYPCRPSSVIR